MKDNFIIILLRNPLPARLILPERVSLCNCLLLSSTKLQQFKKIQQNESYSNLCIFGGEWKISTLAGHNLCDTQRSFYVGDGF